MSAMQPEEIVAEGWMGRSKMAALMRSLDWSQTLGSAQTWSASLQTALNILFHSGCPMLLVWGHDRILVYNDAYAAVVSENTLMFGRSLREITWDGWSRVASAVETVFTTRQSVQCDHPLAPTPANGRHEVLIYTWCYHPLWDETGQVSGVFASAYPIKTAIAPTVAPADEHPIETTQYDPDDLLRIAAQIGESEERFRLVTQAVNGLIFDWNLQTNQVYRSDKLYDLVGVDAEAAPPGPEWWHQRIHPDDMARLYPKITELLASSKSLYDAEYRVRHEDGHWVDVWEQACWLRDEQGQVTRIVGCTMDISDRKRAELALQDKEQQLQQLSDSMPQFVWICDARGMLHYVNQQWSEFSGLSLEQTQDHTLLASLYHPDDQQMAFEQWAIALNNQQAFEMEARLQRSADGAYRWFLIRAIPGLNDQGQVLHWYGTSTDIHERKQRELNDQFLSQLDVRLRQLSDVQVMVQETISSLGEYLNLDRCAFVEMDWQHGLAIVEQDWCRGVPSLVGTYSVANFVTPEFQAELATGQVAIVQDVVTDPRTAAFADNYALFQTRAFANAPCIYQGHWVADLTISSKTPRVWRIDEVSLLQASIARLWPLIEQTRAVQALRASEERFRISQELSLDAFTILDCVRDDNGAIADFIWTYVNPKAAEILNHPAEELVGQRLLTILPGNKLNSELFERYVRVVETGEPHDIELSYESDGIIGWFRNMAVKLKDGVAIFFSDITERKQSEVALRESERRFRRLVESNMFGVAFGDFGGAIEYVNDYFLDMVGYSREEIEQKQIRWIDITPPEFLPLDEQAADELMINGVATPFEKEYIRKDGSRVPILIGAALLQEPYDQQQEIIAFYVDLTERKQAEAERERLLQQAQAAREEAETANRIKDEFLAVLSHELRSPLNPILGWSKLLQTRTFNHQSTQQALQTIERNARLQTQLIDDLLDVSRILRGKLALNICPVDLVTVIESALETVRLAVEAKHIQINTELLSDAVHTLGDAARLQQIVWNLLSNAVKFTPEGGHIDVRLSLVDPSLAPGKHPLTYYAQIQVQDTGKGISPDFLPYVFDYFRQEDSKITRRFGGLGLGLAIVRHLTELHGGRVHVESEGDNLGATFTIQLPLIGDTTEPGKPIAMTSASIDLKQLTILVVDDEADMRHLVQVILEQYQVQVRVATSAIEALTLFDQQFPDLIISDIGMPDMDGYGLMQQIRARSPQQGGLIPAIALTAYAGEYDQRQALKVGFQRHLAKPIDPDELVNAISELITTQKTLN